MVNWVGKSGGKGWGIHFTLYTHEMRIILGFPEEGAFYQRTGRYGFIELGNRPRLNMLNKGIMAFAHYPVFQVGSHDRYHTHISTKSQIIKLLQEGRNFV